MSAGRKEKVDAGKQFGQFFAQTSTSSSVFFSCPSLSVIRISASAEPIVPELL